MPQVVRRLVREGHANWAQQEWLLSAPPDPATSPAFNMVSVIDVPALPPRDVIAALTTCIDRHESLRTLLSAAPGSRATQHVMAAPSARYVADELTETVDRDAAAERFDKATRQYFDPGRTWPLRMTMSLHAGLVERCLLTVDHSAADGWGVKVLTRDFGSLLRLPETSAGLVARERLLQPLDLAHWERSPAGRNHLRRALEFHRGQMVGLRDTVPVKERPKPVSPPPPEARFRNCILYSESLFLAADRASRKLAVHFSTVFMVAYARAMCVAGDQDAIGILVQWNNRFLKGADNSVSKLSLRAPVIFAPFGGRSTGIADQARACLEQQISAQRFAYVDPYELARLREAIFPDIVCLDVGGSVFDYQEESEPPASLSAVPGSQRDHVILLDERETRGARRRLRVLRFPGSVAVSINWQEDLFTVAETETLVNNVVEQVHRMAG